MDIEHFRKAIARVSRIFMPFIVFFFAWPEALVKDIFYKKEWKQYSSQTLF